MKNKINYLLGLFLIYGTAAWGDPSVSVISTSSTSAVQSAPQAAGTAYLTCSVDTRAKVAATATQLSPLVKAGVITPIAVTAGQYISLLSKVGPGHCDLNRFDSDDLALADDADIAGELVVHGDAGFKGNIDLGSAQVTGLPRGQNLFFDGADAGISSLQVKNLAITGTCTGTGCATGAELTWWGDGGFNDATVNRNLIGPARGGNLFMTGSDAGFATLYAQLGQFTGTPGASGLIAGVTGGVTGIWYGIAPGSIATGNYGTATTGTDLLLNNNGGGFSFRTSNSVVGSIASDGAITSASTKTRGAITMTGGTGTATVLSGALCVCSDISASPAVVRCTVSSTTLTAAGTDGHVANYICL